jgi:hypothetical protein
MDTVTLGLRASKTAEQAEQLLRCLSGGSITLRVSTGLCGEDARGLGLTKPNFEDVELGPVAMTLRNDGKRVVQISAATVRRIAESRGTTANDMLACVAAALVRDELVPVTTIEPEYAGVVEYMYNLVLSE